MIDIMNRAFALHTKHTSYVMAVHESGYLFHLYYGARIPFEESTTQVLMPRFLNSNGCAIIADENWSNLCLDDVCLEASGSGRGDMREPFVDLEWADGSRTTDFRYESHEILKEKYMPAGLPGAIITTAENTGSNSNDVFDNNDIISDNNGTVSDNNSTASNNNDIVSDNKGIVSDNNGISLMITLKDRYSELRLDLIYSVFEDCDCICRSARLRNEGMEPVKVRRLMSGQLDCCGNVWKISSFHGDWAREMDKHDSILTAGKFISDSLTGFSSNRANPFVMFGQDNVTEESGECYGCNLIYSGNHRESFEIGGHGKFRMLTGIHPDHFSWNLQGGEALDAPECVYTFSENGYRDISIHMHEFVREHIVRGTWKKKERPILINSWESMYFDVKEKKLLKLAKVAKNLGVELFVLDDGWFGKRDDDKSSLGDWFDHKEKLAGGLSGLSQKIHAMGLQFGIWVEPEMISEDSDLYRAHPEYAVGIPESRSGCKQSLGRNQMLLDLTQQAVRDYVIETMSDVFTRGQVDYVKWDMNRNFSDYYSVGDCDQGEFAHRYILGLYEILDTLTQRHPDILFEGCASGGNRFDLGILCYMPQIWASDNTDALCRANIQNGYSYGYPQSVMTAHVSSCPNHQTLRILPMQTRFDVAAMGLLGYELNLCDLSKEDRKEIREQITLYKKWRETLQFGQIYRLPLTGDTDQYRWAIVSEDRDQAIAVCLQDRCQANYAHHSLKMRGLDPERSYHFYNLPKKVDIRRMGSLVNTVAPIHVKQESFTHDMIARFVKLEGEREDSQVSGALLMRAGIPLTDHFSGTGYADGTAMYQDGESRMYFMEQHRN